METRPKMNDLTKFVKHVDYKGDRVIVIIFF